MLSSNENTIIHEYINFYKKYREIYGENIVILLEVGSFYEIYSHMSEPSKDFFDIYHIANLLNLTVSRKNNKGEKRNESISVSNHYMCGFPNYNVNKYINMLVNSNYIVVVINQRDSENPIDKKKEHYVSEIVSPSTYYNDDILSNGGSGCNNISNNGSNELMTIYIQENKDRKTGHISLFCHIAMCDIYTGNIKLFEIINNNIEITFEELNRLFYYKPKEVVMFGDIKNINIDKQLQVISSQNFLFLNRIGCYNKEILKLSYQNEIIKKVYGINKIKLLNPIDYIQLGNRPDFVVSVCYLFAFIYEHNEKLIYNLNLPVIIEDFTDVNRKHMILTNNSIKDLNIISDNPNELCINKLLNKCQTSIGKRFFNFMLKNPLISQEILEIYYHLTELFQKSEIINKNCNYLKKINDIEKLVRKMKQYKLNPFELFNIKNSIKHFYDLIIYIHMEYKDLDLIYKIINENIDDFNIFNQSMKFLEFYNATFNESALSKYSIHNITENIFAENYNKEITNLQFKINKIEKYYNDLCNDLNKFMNEEMVANKNKSKTTIKKNTGHKEVKFEQYFKIEINSKLDNLNRVEIKNQKEFDKYNDIEYYYIYTTKTRFDKFKTLFKESDSKLKQKLIGEYNFQILKTEPVTNSANSTHIKLIFSQTNNLGLLLNQYKQQIHELIYNEYNKIIFEIMDEYSRFFDISIKFIGIIDYITNNAYNANKYNYIKPVINCEKRNESEPSYLKIKGLRHPIIEQINNNTEYIPNDIEIGTKNSYTSYLLYGVNTIGKSSLLKSVGISIVMASAGMFASASFFEFKPFHHIFSHINKSDDIWKNLSLFSSDMLSIKSFLNMMSNKSLILSDELMNSSETESSISILGATINKLVSNNVCHIFTTHFHELRKLSLIRQLHNDGKLRLCYLHVQYNGYNNECNNFIFDRKLRDIDDEHLDLYGLEIAKGLNLPSDFLLDANKIRQEVLEINSDIICTKKSKYNSMIYIDKCGICGTNKNLEVHHILFQQNAVEKGFIKSDVVESGNNGIHKNRAFNLIPICQKCHDDIHNGIKKITGFTQSINGLILQ